MPIPHSRFPALPDLQFVQEGPGLAPGHDALLLARAVEIAPGSRVLDLGTGCGVVALAIASRVRVEVVALELLAGPLDTARRNRDINRALLEGTVDFIRGDLRRLPFASGAFDAVVMNPPYIRANEGRISPDPVRAAARHEIHGTLRDWVAAAATALRTGGMCWCVIRPDRGDDLEGILSSTGFHSIRKWDVAPDDESKTAWVLVRAVRTKG
jgi:tRNA1Val (adenine37-N6)-methyltransferase